MYSDSVSLGMVALSTQPICNDHLPPPTPPPHPYPPSLQRQLVKRVDQRNLNTQCAFEKELKQTDQNQWHHRSVLLCLCPALQRADIGLGGMTITYDREQYVDFTKPYLTLGITILYRKPIPKPPDLFSFLSPLSVEVS